MPLIISFWMLLGMGIIHMAVEEKQEVQNLNETPHRLRIGDIKEK